MVVRRAERLTYCNSSSYSWVLSYFQDCLIPELLCNEVHSNNSMSHTINGAFPDKYWL